MNTVRVLTLFLSFLFLQILTEPIRAGDTSKTADTEVLLGYLAGKYRLIGQMPNNGISYIGRVTFREVDGALEMKRMVNGKTVSGTARIERATSDRVPILRVQFTFDGKMMEATYLWCSDLDNYPQLTGHLYNAAARTQSPGLEALFPVHE